MAIIDSVEEYESIMESMPKMALPYSAAEVRETFEALFEFVGAYDEISDVGADGMRMRRAFKRLPVWIIQKGISNG